MLHMPVEARLCALIRPNGNVLYRASKRLMDLIASCAALLALSPVILLVALAIKLEAPGGKIFFSQLRAGRAASPFGCTNSAR